MAVTPPALLGSTDPRLEKESLATGDDKYRGLFEHSLDAVYLTLADGTILDANPSACALHGMTLEELRRAGRAGLVVQDARHAAALAARAAGGHVRAEMTIRRKDGSTAPVEVQSVLLDPGRADSPAFVISRDISERERANAELRAMLEGTQRAEEELRRAVEEHQRQARLFDGVTSTTPDFVYVFDRQGRFLYANRRLLEVWGMRLPDVVGKTCRELGYEQWHHDMHMREIAQVIATRQPIKGEVPFKAPLTGIFGIYEYIFTPVLGPDGEVEIIAGTTRDVTERKRAEEALRESDRRKDEFLGMLSHELRNPLAPIRNATYVLRHAPAGSDQARRAQVIIERQTEHLTRLVDDLLDVTRIARGKIQLRRERVDLRQVVERAAEDLHPLLARRGVGFTKELPDGAVWADADPTRVAQIVSNLLHNASKFTRSGDEVALSLEVHGEEAELRVRDTGVGVDPALLPRIFEAFVQGERTLARTEGGLGLGLALVKGLAELHGGSVQVESAGPGKGATFTVRLPVAARGAARPAHAPATPRPPARVRRVLIVDDNQDAAESLADLVRMLGHVAAVAHDGPSAVEAAQAIRPDTVLCDIGLPGMDGYAVAQALRASALRGLQLVAISGYAQPEDTRRALEAGFDGHVAKPPDPEKIARLLS